MANFNFQKVSQLMTAKERAKLVVKLQFQSLAKITPEDVQRYEDGWAGMPNPPETYEIKHLVRICPQEQVDRYNFLIGLKKYIWERTMQKIRDDLIGLDLLEGSSAAMKYQLGISPVIYFATETLARMPVVVRKDDYNEALKRALEARRAEVLKLEGNDNLVEQEAYYRLVKEGKIEDGELSGYLLFINNHNKTEEGLLTEKLQHIKAGVEEYLKTKERLGGDEPSFDYFARYIGLTDEEIRAKAKIDYPGHFDIPPKAEAELWLKTLQEEKERLLQAVEDGKLKSKDGGVEAGSYYDWKDRYQKYAGEQGTEEKGWNPQSEDCMEIGLSNGKVMSSLESEDSHDWRNIIVTSVHDLRSTGGSLEAVNSHLNCVDEFLKQMNFFEVSKKNFDTRKRTIKISSPEYDRILKSYVKSASEKIADIHNQLALIEIIENKYFDGMEIMERSLDSASFSTERVKNRVKAFIEMHNGSIQDIVFSFNRLGSGFWEFQLEGIENYTISDNFQSDQEWVERKLKQIEEET